MNKVILASSSPRRREILEKYDFKYKVVESNITEKINSRESPEQIAMSLAFEKAYNVSQKYRDSIVIGADTIVAYKNQTLGKPRDENDIIRTLNLLSGKKHEVITAISLINLDSNIKIVDFERTEVKFRQLDPIIIQKYVATGESLDKAGAYGIQGYGALLVEKIEGCYLNVVGLPLVKLDKLLNEYFNISIL
ncbi:Maf family protein [Wansuia hejianensis]|uniref:dTTP/UTP pyrophosphatase n=1 Tax=Wansuia hejianensis TaxID=2763667 RepID=A0A926EYQ4_9FIRM|nr:Maf family protein [Wansuia hejianensis]MBC8590828.1 septum formation inhibitor Maf [Wansuia hejianensis]